MILYKFAFIFSLLIIHINAGKNVVCYYGSWAAYRPWNGQCNPEDINPKLCTHLIYAFAGINTDGTVRVVDPDLSLPSGSDGFNKFTALKSINPQLKTLIAIGGWSEGSDTFSQVFGNAQKRTAFVNSVISFITQYKFDGLDLDWEYPNQRGGVPQDVNSLTLLLKELRTAFNAKGLLLSIAAAGSGPSALLSYNIVEIVKYVDFINLMTYDLHGPWESITGFTAPLYPRNDEPADVKATLNVAACVDYWLTQGAPAAKINLGIPFYGYNYLLSNPVRFRPGSEAVGPAFSGPYTKTVGLTGYNEVCAMPKANWTMFWDCEQRVAYMVDGYNWVGYDNEKAVGNKTSYAISKNLGGVMIWSYETDDFRGQCGKQSPLLNAINDVLNGVSTVTTTTTRSPTPVGFVCTAAGYFRDPKDCSKFYRCVPNKNSFLKYDFSCPAGLYFDLNSLNCNWPANVNCKV